MAAAATAHHSRRLPVGTRAMTGLALALSDRPEIISRSHASRSRWMRMSMLWLATRGEYARP